MYQLTSVPLHEIVYCTCHKQIKVKDKYHLNKGKLRPMKKLITPQLWHNVPQLFFFFNGWNFLFKMKAFSYV